VTTDCALITGGAGFIGAALGTRLAESGATVVAIDNLHPQIHKGTGRPAALHPDVELFIGDVTERGAWDRFLSEYTPGVIFHFAAETGTAQSLTEATRHADVNVVGTTRMLDALVRFKAMPKRVILASSRAVYGEGKWRSKNGQFFYPGPRTHAQLTAAQWVPTDSDGNPGTPCSHNAQNVFSQPTSIYGATKLAQENILKSWCAAYDIPLGILRLQNVYGVGQSPYNPYTGIINIFHNLARSGQPIQVYEDGNIERDFVYITDVVNAFEKLLYINIAGVEIIDVGYGDIITINEAAKIISKIHESPCPVICGKFRDGDIRAAHADISRLSSILGTRPKIDFAIGARLVGEWLESSGYA
jgi:dTDP-L-rhamnose 4-epimerase